MPGNFDPSRAQRRRVLRPVATDSRAQTFPTAQTLSTYDATRLRDRFIRTGSYPQPPTGTPSDPRYPSDQLNPANGSPVGIYNGVPTANVQPTQPWYGQHAFALPAPAPTHRYPGFQDALAQLAPYERSERAFVMTNGYFLEQARFTPEDMLLLARIPQAWDYVLTQALLQRERGYDPRQIMLQALYSPAQIASERQNTRIQAPAATARRRRHRRPRTLPSNLEQRPEDQLREEERTNLEDAHSRWSTAADRRQAGLEFYLKIVPIGLADKIAGRTNLILLLAGLAYVEDNWDDSTSSSHRQEVKAATRYLMEAEDSGLIASCDDAARDYVGYCGDGVSAGFAALKETIQDHELDQIERNRDLLKQATRLFVQRQINQEAVALDPEESSGVAIYLSRKLRDDYALEGVQTTRSTRFPIVYEQDATRVREIAERLRNEIVQPGEIYLSFLQSKPAIQKRLRQLFPEDYSRMDHDLDAFTELAESAMEGGDAIGSSASAADRTAGAEIGRDLLLSLGNAHKQWYQEKLKEVLSDPIKLDGEMVQ